MPDPISRPENVEDGFTFTPTPLQRRHIELLQGDEPDHQYYLSDEEMALLMERNYSDSFWTHARFKFQQENTFGAWLTSGTIKGVWNQTFGEEELNKPGSAYTALSDPQFRNYVEVYSGSKATEVLQMVQDEKATGKGSGGLEVCGRHGADDARCRH